MTSAGPPSPELSPAAPGPRDVARLAAGILRRHAPLLVLLALVLEVAPVLLHTAMAEPVRRAIAPPYASYDAYIVALTMYYAYFGAYGLDQCLAFACNVAVVLVGLEGDQTSGSLTGQARGILLRLAVPSLAVWCLSRVLLLRLPQPWGSFAYVALSCWTVVLPVYAAEKTPLARLAGRSRAIFARGRRCFAIILGLYCAGAVGLSLSALHLGAVVGRDPAAVWVGLTAFSSLVATFNIVSDMAVVALYRELRRRERATPPPEIVEAFA